MGDRAAEGGQAEFEERGEDFACASLLPLKACPGVRIVHLSPLRSEGEAGLIVTRSVNPVEAFHSDPS